MNRIYLSPPDISTNELSYVQEAIRSNWVTSMGKNIDNFEKKLEDYLGENSSVLALNSGTSALHLGLILLGVQAGEEVLCQSLTFAASANPITYLGAKPIFIDSEEQTWNISPEVLEQAIQDRISNGKKPKAIVAVHLYGMPYQVDKIKEISQTYDIPVLEDAASTLGSSYKNQKCGTFGTLGIISFNGNKIITTSAGGALITPSLESKKEALFLATQARENTPHYEHTQVGYNYRMSNICAGIGCGQMEVLPEHIRKRREIFLFYKDFFSSLPYVSLLEEPTPDYFSNRWLSTILIHPNKKNKNREDLRKYLESENIESRPLWKPMHLQPLYKNEPYYGGKTAENLFTIGLCLPSGSSLSPQDKQRIKTALETYFFD